MILSRADFAELFGGEIDDQTALEIAAHDFSYESCGPQETMAICLNLLKRIDAKQFSIAGERIDRWETGWSQNLLLLQDTKDLAALRPRYLRQSNILRLNGEFIKPADPDFEANWFQVYRSWFARKYLAPFDAIYEFGCGSGHNIAFLAKLFPQKKIFGFDWAPASVKILDFLRDDMGFANVEGAYFDFFRPASFHMVPNAAILTMGALEQTGTVSKMFFDFLRQAQPAMCFHIEPLLAQYNPESLVDWTATSAHKARNFWTPDLEGKECRRVPFGSLLLEGYSRIQWCPHAADALEGAP